jgi:hypothetical protein
LAQQVTKKKSASGYDLLTGNPFVDNGLAAIAASAGYKSIDELTLRKIKLKHGDGMDLARRNNRLRATWSIFPDSMLTNPSFSKDPHRLENYAKLTTAVLNNIGHESIAERCDICGNARSVDLNQLFEDVLPEPEPESEGNYSGKNKSKDDEGKRYICRDWFPLAGSMKNDAQALPAASRSLNCCARCLFAVQYLPQVVFSVKGRLTVFSSTSLTLWFGLAKSSADRIKNQLDAQSDKIATIGTKGSGKGSSFSDAIRRVLRVMRNLARSDIGSVSLWMFTNIGMEADCEKQRIPNAALEFLYEVARHVPDIEVNRLIDRDTKNYQTSLLNCVINRTDYLSLYPSKKYGNDGASHKMFMLYQTIVLVHSVSSLRTAYKIAEYVKAKAGEEESDRLGIDLDKALYKQRDVRKLIVHMVTDGLLSLDEYYDLFVVGRGSGNGHPWRLIKYYLLTDSDVNFPVSPTEIHPTTSDGESRYRARFESVGKAIRDSYIARKGVARFEREVLGGLAHSQLGERWLWNQLKILAEEAQQQEPQTSFDPQATWSALAAGDNIHELLYLLRLLWTSQTFTTT